MILIFRHSVGTPPGLVTEYLERNKLDFHTHFWGQDSLASLERISIDQVRWLFVLGGPQNVDEVGKYTWLLQEKTWIQSYLKGSGLYTGLCLGGQLLAEALGGKVGRHTEYEMGWHEIELDPSASVLVQHSPPKLQVFEYHGYSFQTPEGAKSFAQNRTTPHQGFVYQDRCVGVQFHPEATPDWVRYCAKEKDFPRGRAVQDPKAMVFDIPRFLPPQKDWFFTLLDQQRARLTR